jgi:hypothetical protein
LTAQGHPRAIFRRAVERGNVVVAEATAREIGLSLEEALQLVLLYAAYEPQKLERAALRWFRGYLEEGKGVRGVRPAERARSGRLAGFVVGYWPPAVVVFCGECAEREFDER